MSSFGLLQTPSNSHLAELLWRIGLPIAAFVLALLAIPLSFVNPRASRSVNLLFALFTYMVYANMLSIVQAWVSQGRLAFNTGWWVVHAGMLGVLALLFYKRLRVGSLLGTRALARGKPPVSHRHRVCRRYARLRRADRPGLGARGEAAQALQDQRHRGERVPHGAVGEGRPAIRQRSRSPARYEPVRYQGIRVRRSIPAPVDQFRETGTVPRQEHVAIAGDRAHRLHAQRKQCAAHRGNGLELGSDAGYSRRAVRRPGTDVGVEPVPVFPASVREPPKDGAL